jgi:hypothetical protein
MNQFIIHTLKVNTVENSTQPEYGKSKYAASGESRRTSKIRSNRSIIKNTA